MLYVSCSFHDWIIPVYSITPDLFLSSIWLTNHINPALPDIIFRLIEMNRICTNDTTAFAPKLQCLNCKVFAFRKCIFLLLRKDSDTCFLNKHKKVCIHLLSTDKFGKRLWSTVQMLQSGNAKWRARCLPEPGVACNMWMETTCNASQTAVYVPPRVLPRSRDAHPLWLCHSPRDHRKPRGRCCACRHHSCLLSLHEPFH